MAAVGAAISYPSVPFTKLASKVKWNMFRLGFGLLCSQNMKKKSVFWKFSAQRRRQICPASPPFRSVHRVQLFEEKVGSFCFCFFLLHFVLLWRCEREKSEDWRFFFPNDCCWELRHRLPSGIWSSQSMFDLQWHFDDQMLNETRWRALRCLFC